MAAIIVEKKKGKRYAHTFPSIREVEMWMYYYWADTQNIRIGIQRIWDALLKEGKYKHNQVELELLKFDSISHCPVSADRRLKIEAMQFCPDNAGAKTVASFDTIQEAVDFLLRDTEHFEKAEFGDEGWRKGNYDYTKKGTAYSIYQDSNGQRFTPVCEHMDGTRRFIYFTYV